MTFKVNQGGLAFFALEKHGLNFSPNLQANLYDLAGIPLFNNSFYMFQFPGLRAPIIDATSQ